MLRRISGFAVLLFLAYACGDPTTTSSPSGPSSPTVTSLTVTGTLTISTIGQTSQLTATAHFAKGTTENVTGQCSWSSSDTKIATVSPSGLVTSMDTGTATVTATYHAVSGSTKVTVTQPLSYAISGLVTESVPTTSTVLSGVRIDFTDPRSQGWFATTDTTGRYQIAKLPAGNYTVRASLSGYADGSRQVTVSGNTSIDFALVPTPTSIWFKRTGSISDGSGRCAGESNPCQVFAVPPIHNAGAFESTLLWTDSSASLAFQLVNADTGQVVVASSAPGQTSQHLTTQILAPGNYQLRVLGVTISGAVPFELHVTACPN